MALLLVGIWVVTWTPYSATAALQLLGYADLVPPQVHMAALVLAKCSAVVNAFVYGLRLPTFRRRMNVLSLPNFVKAFIGDSSGGCTAPGQQGTTTAVAQFRAQAAFAPANAMRRKNSVSFADEARETVLARPSPARSQLSLRTMSTCAAPQQQQIPAKPWIPKRHAIMRAANLDTVSIAV
jgi:hypothetical protein